MSDPSNHLVQRDGTYHQPARHQYRRVRCHRFDVVQYPTKSGQASCKWPEIPPGFSYLVGEFKGQTVVVLSLLGAVCEMEAVVNGLATLRNVLVSMVSGSGGVGQPG